MKQGWVWDLDDFGVNQIGHPYQGNNYYNAARGHGLSFWESAGVTAFGSGTWEYFGETNHASVNDLINTTLGGMAIGEVLHRTAWLVRDPRASGRRRMTTEIAAMVIDPVTGGLRFASGDATRLSDKPAEMVPSALGGIFAGGVLWRGTDTARLQRHGPTLSRDGFVLRRPDHRSQPDAVRRLCASSFGSAAAERSARRERKGACSDSPFERQSRPAECRSELRLLQERCVPVRRAVVHRA